MIADTPGDNQVRVSKNQMKRQLKLQRWQDSKHERRKQEKEKRKLKRQMDAKLAAEMPSGAEISRPERRIKTMSESSNKFKVIIDMDFNEYMTSAEMKKSAQQVARIYSLNRHSEHPCQLYITSLKGAIRDQFDLTNTGYKNWDVNISETDYKETIECNNQDIKDDSVSKLKPSFVYLTGDSNETLADVDSILKDTSKVYVIGGLVDHNRHKDLCHKRAQERNIATAKLPIKEHVILSQREILSTVTVFEILLKVLGSTMSWSEALKSSIPKRKMVQKSPIHQTSQVPKSYSIDTNCDRDSPRMSSK